ncbi:DsrE family protein [Sphingomicrobium lutaoense]|uniref:Intracellular sulfur oxidation DsrE/DsrF family protein n=1 Tax=Sphingomicrobium lutaoense TaxID=515949 RepID=A0A839Z6Y7_9SPHN|nr:DsrE family protein [Sphingomicrobium lutaoense]MBB3764524.1 intracellular sulfur oxidation DsrE/DsrF family protein [Sphingomicrobium lutaoense]
MLLALLLAAQPADWPTGPIIEGHGPHASVEATMDIPQGTVLMHAFDAVELGEDGKSRTLQSIARFINMHAAAGVPADAIRPAVVVHGPAVFALTRDERFGEKFEGKANPNAELVAGLLAHGTRISVCGQSAAAQDVANEDLLPGVEVALSAMTAHALLQRQGYTVNPF